MPFVRGLQRFSGPTLPGGFPWRDRIHAAGILALRPPPGPSNVGLLYLATDAAGGTLYRSTGVVWVACGSGVTSTGGLTELTGDVTAGPGVGSQASTIGSHVVSNGKFRQSSALSVVGNSTNVTADVADISAATDEHALRRSGTAVGFGTLAGGAFADDTIAPARLAFSATKKIAARKTAAAGLGEESTTSEILDFIGTPVQGDILYRGASAWAGLPAGSVGQVLKLATGPVPAWSDVSLPSLLANGGFEISQRLATATADDVYTTCDRWYSLSQTTSITVTRELSASISSGRTSRYCAKALNGGTSQRMGIAQILEGVNSFPLRGRRVRFQAALARSSSANMRMAIVEWTGTVDAVTSDVVDTWTSTNYSSGAGNFFITPNLMITATSASLAAGTNWAVFSVSGTVSASCNNLILFIWDEGTAASQAIYMTEVGLYPDDVPQPWLPKSVQANMAECQRYALQLTDHPLGSAVGASNLYSRGSTVFPVAMRTTPTLTSGTYTVTVGTAGTVSLNSPSNVSTGFANVPANWTTGTIVTVTALLDAEL